MTDQSAAVYFGRVLVIGCGATGVAVLQTLRAHNLQCTVIDPRPGSNFRSVCRLLKRLDVAYKFGREIPKDLSGFTTVVRCGVGGPGPVSAIPITPRQVAEMFPGCPFAADLKQILEGLGNKIAAVRRPQRVTAHALKRGA